MSAGELDYVAGLGTLLAVSPTFHAIGDERITKFENVKSQKSGGSNCD